MYTHQRDLVNKMVRQVKTQYYEGQVLECGSDQKRLFRVVKGLMEPKAEVKSSLSAEHFSEQFAAKIGRIRDGFPPSSVVYSEAQASCSLTQFDQITEEILLEMIRAAPSKTCDLDPWPTWLLMEHLQVLSPVLTTIVNRLLQ